MAATRAKTKSTSRDLVAEVSFLDPWMPSRGVDALRQTSHRDTSGFQFGGENSGPARVIYGVGGMRSAKTTILSSYCPDRLSSPPQVINRSPGWSMSPYTNLVGN